MIQWGHHAPAPVTGGPQQGRQPLPKACTQYMYNSFAFFLHIVFYTHFFAAISLFNFVPHVWCRLNFTANILQIKCCQLNFSQI